MRGLATLSTILGFGLALTLPQAGYAQSDPLQPELINTDPASPASGEAELSWETIVVGQPGPGAQRSFADAFHASQAFERGGLPLRDMIRDMPRARLTDTLAALEDVPRLLVFYSGRIPSGSISMQDGTMPLATVMASAAAAGTQEMILMVENCTDQSTTPSQVIVPDAPENMALMVVASAADGGSCQAGLRLSDQLQKLAEEPALVGDLMGMLDGVAITGDVPTPVALTGPLTIEGPAEEVVVFLPDDVLLLPVLDGDFSLSGGDDTLADDVIEIVLPARVPELPEIPEELAAEDTTVTFAALPLAQLAALPVAVGLPEPSIIVGLIEGVTNASLGTDPEAESVSLADFPDDNRAIAASLATLRTMRDGNPDLFASMLGAGTFDPPQGRVMAKVIQTELGRMRCYRGGIDGDFGPGSRRGSTAYFAEIKKKDIDGLDSADASVELFRLIVGNDEVKCPEPAPVAARSRSTSSSTARATTRSTTTRSAPSRTQTRTAAPSAPSRPAATPSRPAASGGFGVGGGVFR